MAEAGFDHLVTRTFAGRHWKNMGSYCNRKTHAYGPLGYRKYRRGKNRCVQCGAKIGKVDCTRKSYKEGIVDSIFEPSPFLKALAEMGKRT